MDTQIAFYQQCIKTLLAEYHTLQTQYAHIEVVFDDERMRYMVMWVGWMKQKRIHACVAHIDILDDLVIIQCNNTEEPLADALVQMGIPKERIGLGCIPPEARQYAEYSAQFTRPEPLYHDTSCVRTANA